MSAEKAKKSYPVLVAGSILLLLYICYIQINRNEISNVHFIQMFCIDRTDDGFQVSALYEDAGSKSENTLQFADGNGSTVYNAFEDLKRKDSKELTITHTSVYLLSTSAAEYGLTECLDFISRDETVKTNASVFILRADNANKVLNNAIKDKFLPQEMLNSLIQKQSHALKKVDNNLMAVLNNMNSPYNNLLIPTLAYDGSNLYEDGYAAFKQAKLFEFLDYQTSIAIDLFRNRLRTCPITVNDNLTLALSDLNVIQDVHITNNALNLTLSMEMNSEIKEVAASKNVFTDETLASILKMEKESLKDLFEHVVYLMQRDKLDLLDLSTYFSNESASVKASYNKNWDYYLQNMNYQLIVNSTIAKNYIISK